MAKNNSVKKERKSRIDRLLNFSKNSYFERTSRPLCAAAFLLPFIIFYEIGTILINTDVLRQSQIRVVAFVWLQDFLEYLGFASKFAWIAPPLAVLIILLSLQVVSRKPWKVLPKDLWKMALESIALALPLLLFNMVLVSTPRNPQPAPANPPSVSSAGHLQSEGWPITCSSQNTNQWNPPGRTSAGYNQPASRPGLLADIVTGIGAGIYEELIFRLILISLLMIFLYDVCGFPHGNAIIISVILSAALFSVYHHIDFLTGRQTEPFELMRFLFRTIAGVYFAVLFAVRGFGITAGTHAFYDIIAVFINAYLGFC
jgi:hypothetical protein